MEQSEAVEKFVDRIKHKYIQRRLNREKQWPPCKSEKLLRLELVEGEQREGYSAGKTRGSDSKAVKRSPITYSDILKAKKDGRRAVRKVLVEGDAGIGKTTLCIALSEDWANGKLFCEFKILLLLHLRQMRIASVDSLLGLLKLLHSSEKVCEFVAEYVKNEDEKVLIVADGWDELSTQDRSEGSILYDLLFGERYSLSVIVTSRPYASAQLRDLPCIDQLVEVHGFSKDNIKEFIQCEFANDVDKGSGLLEQLEGNPLIESVCSVPLNCAIICHLCHHFEGALPTTMTELYTTIVLNVILRNIQKKSEYESITSLPHFDSLPSSLQQPWSLLCELAFLTLSEDKVVFSHEEVSTRFQNVTSALCFGLLQSAESVLLHGHGVSFHFLHLTFQEYLAALYLVRQPTDKQLQLCQFPATSGRLDMVWRFFFGIKFVICKQAVYSKVLTKLMRYKYRPGYDHQLSLCHFALEANQRSVDTLIASKIRDANNDGYIRFHARTAFDSAAVIHVITNLQDCCIIIDLSDYGLGDKQITSLASALADKYGKLHVRSLSLCACGNRLSDQSLTDFFDRASPAFNQSLWEVILSNNIIGPKTINSLTTVLAKSFSNYDDDEEVYPSLCLAEASLGVDGVRALVNALCANSLACLQKLSLARSLTDDANTNAELILALGSGHCSRLKELDLYRNNLGTPGGKALGQVLSGLCALISLDLAETMLGDEGISALIQNLNGTCELTYLGLDGNGFQAAGISCLTESICTGRIKLSPKGFFWLHYNPVGLEGVISVVKILINSHFQARDICLSGCQLTTAGESTTNPDSLNAVDIQRSICSQQLQTTRSFHELVVNDNNFSGEGIHILAAFMYACPCAERLYSCSSCGITSNDLKQLLDLISKLSLKFPYLKRWDLSDNDIDDDGVSALIEHLSMFPKLRLISLDDNTRVSPEMLKTLKKELGARRPSFVPPHVYFYSFDDDEWTEIEDYGEQASPHSDTDPSGSNSKDGNSELIQSKDYGEDSSSYMEDSDTEEQYRAAEETRITAVTTEAECVSGNQQEVVHPSASSSPTIDSSRDYHSEKASPHVVDSVKEVVIYNDFQVQSFQEGPEIIHESATSRWRLQNVHKVLTGEGVVIAVLDTGIDTGHEAFKEKLTQIKGYNFVPDGNSAFSKPEPHGSMAAFVAAGKGFTAQHGQKGEKIKPHPIDIASGVAPNAKLVVCRVGTPYRAEYIIKALEKLIEVKRKERNGPKEWGVDIISMSFGTINDTLTASTNADKNKIRDLIEELFILKVIVVAAAGNYGDNRPVLFPASHPNVFSVGALNIHNKPAALTPSCDIDVYAPGTKIAAPLVHKDIHDGMEITQGTSCATPAIAGLVALKIQFEKNKHELLKDIKREHVNDLLCGENIHFQDMKKMFEEMADKRLHVLDPYKYFKVTCYLNIK